jgi:hypothetical protein
MHKRYGGVLPRLKEGGASELGAPLVARMIALLVYQAGSVPVEKSKIRRSMV